MSEKEENVDALYDTRARINREKKRIRNAEGITPSNKNDLLEFLEWCEVRGNKGRPLSISRICIYAQRLLALSRMFGETDFRVASQKDLEGVAAQIERGKIGDGSKEFLCVTLKKFYSWLENGGASCPDKLKWLRSTHARENGFSVNPEDLLTSEEIRKLIDAADSTRDKALIAILAESGCRIGEMASMKIKNISYDKFGAKITVNGKTGKRTVRLLSSINYLTAWASQHPGRSNPEAPLWCIVSNNRSGEFLPYHAYTALLNRIAGKAGITKRVNPHSFRHAAATRLASLGLSNTQMAACLGWVPGTDMVETYVHLSGKNVDDALLKAYGLQERTDEGIERLKCAKCGAANEINKRYCGDCGMPLTTSAAVSLNESEINPEELLSVMKELREFRESKEMSEFREFKKAIQKHPALLLEIKQNKA